MMNVLQRNFFRLLRCGTFGIQEPLEPLSPWKWDKLYQLSLMHGVTALIYDGMRQMQDDFFLQLSGEQKEQWATTTREIENRNRETDLQVAQLFALFNEKRWRPILMKGQSCAKLYPVPGHRTSGDVDIFFPYEMLAEKANSWAQEQGKTEEDRERTHFCYQYQGVMVDHCVTLIQISNPLLNRRLQRIINAEIRCCDSCYTHIGDAKVECLPYTLNLLTMMVRISRYMLNDGISLKQLLDLALFLRKQGDKVDYVKLQQWLAKLQMKRMVKLIGGLLMTLFRFTEDELPFMEKGREIPTDDILVEVFRLKGSHSCDWFFTQGKDIFVKASDSNALLWQVRQSMRYMGYWPGESVTNFLTSFARSLAHIEE